MVGAAAYVATVWGEVWIVPVPVKELFFLAMYFEGFGHGEIFIVIQVFWILHGQLIVKPFYGPKAIFNINATLCKEIGISSAVCCSITWFLSSSGNCIARRTNGVAQ
jgi:hypothetical protein